MDLIAWDISSGTLADQDDGTICQDKLDAMLDFIFQLLHHRADSLVHNHTDPPFRWARCLAEDPQTRQAAEQQVVEEWQIILALEAAGRSCRCLENVMWRQNSLLRAVCMGFERDAIRKRSGQEVKHEGSRLLRALLCHLGDSKVVEDSHQHLRDLQREARKDSYTTAAKQHALIRSHVLQARGVQATEVSPAEVATAPVLKQSLNTFTIPESHKMPKEYQSIMKQDKSWHSPATISLFKQSAATEWAMHWMKHKLKTGFENAWMSVLACRAGMVLASTKLGIQLLVLHGAEYGFLAVGLNLGIDKLLHVASFSEHTAMDYVCDNTCKVVTKHVAPLKQ